MSVRTIPLDQIGCPRIVATLQAQGDAFEQLPWHESVGPELSAAEERAFWNRVADGAADGLPPWEVERY